MRGCDCLILSQPGQEEQVAFSKSALGSIATCETASLEELADIETAFGAEMGLLIVPVSDNGGIARIEALVSHFRKRNAHVSVLGVARTCATARRVDLGTLFDGLVSMEWRAASDIIRKFVQSNTGYVQNRAFRAFLDNSVDGYWIWNIPNDQIEWSERTREMTGIPHHKVPKNISGFNSMVHPDDRNRVKQAIHDHLTLNAPYKNIEMRLRRADGRYGNFLANGQALRGGRGQPIILVGSLTDRTLMQSVAQQLEDTQRRFTVLFNQMNDAAVLADVATGLILEANQPAELLWGRKVSELVGSHQSQLHPPKLNKAARKAFSDHIAALMKNQRDTIYVPILRADQSEVPVEISSSLIEIEGKMTILGVFRDISERVKLEREQRELDAQLQLSSHLSSMGTLAAGVAHEINNPLTYVLGNLEIVKDLLEDFKIEDSELNDAIEAASTGGRYVREIVSDLKAISKMDSKDGHCDPCEVVRIASRITMTDLRHRAQLEMTLSDVPDVPISSTRLSQVMLNILSNATRAFPSNDRNNNRISVDVRSVDGWVRIIVEDNGVGISEDDLTRIWEPFFTKNSEKGGTGLGLSICRRILNEIKGSLEITSALGIGTRVTISLPKSKKTKPRVETINQAPVLCSLPKTRLLVLDDEPLVTNLISRMLRQEFTTTVHNDPVKALAEIKGGSVFDLILCDIMMPEMDGRSFEAAVGNSVPCVFLTGGAVTEENIEFERKMFAQGRLLYKPFDSAELRQRLQRVAAGMAQISPTSAPTPKEILPSSNAGVPEPHVLEELRKFLDDDMLRKQFKGILSEVRALLENANSMTSQDLEQASHRVSGAADVMGFLTIGQHLRNCQNAAAANDHERAIVELNTVRSIEPSLASFVGGY